MNPNRLQLFYADEFTREDFREFQLKVLEEMIIKDCYEEGGENVKALAKTKELIDQSYRRLHELFGTKDKPIISNPR